MSRNVFLTVVGVLLAMGAAAHLSRVIFDWHLQIGERVVPRWFSLIAVFVASYLSWTAFRLKKEK